MFSGRMNGFQGGGRYSRLDTSVVRAGWMDFSGGWMIARVDASVFKGGWRIARV